MIFRWFQRLKAYTIHERPNPPALKSERADELVFVKDGFSLFAALVPPVWMMTNRLWLVLAGYIASVLGLIIIFGVLKIPDFWLSYAVVALNLVVGFEADSLIRWTLDRRSWSQIAHVTGVTSEDCERRFFDSWLPTVPEVNAADLAPPGTDGGIEVSTSEASVTPLSGDVMPPKRKNWRSTILWGR